MGWVDYTYVRTTIGTTQAVALGLSTSSSVLTQFEAEARSVIQSLLKANGYAAVGSTLSSSADSTPFLRKLCVSLMVRDLYGLRSGVRFPPTVQDGLAILGAYERGEGKRFPVPGMTQDSAAGIGGSDVTSTDDPVNPRPLVFSRAATRGL